MNKATALRHKLRSLSKDELIEELIGALVRVADLAAPQVTDLAQQPWQPIETAPQDNGVSVIVWDDPVMGEAYYDPGERSWWWTNTGPGEHTSEAIYPTLWQPMPAPPSNQGASK